MNDDVFTGIPILEHGDFGWPSEYGSRHSKQWSNHTNFSGCGIRFDPWNHGMENWPYSTGRFSLSNLRDPETWHILLRIFFYCKMTSHLSLSTMIDHGFMVINRLRLNVVAWKNMGARELTHVPFSKDRFKKKKIVFQPSFFRGNLLVFAGVSLVPAMSH